jgi:hypothetical protein
MYKSQRVKNPSEIFNQKIFSLCHILFFLFFVGIERCRQVSLRIIFFMCDHLSFLADLRDYLLRKYLYMIAFFRSEIRANSFLSCTSFCSMNFTFWMSCLNASSWDLISVALRVNCFLKSSIRRISQM